MRLKRSNASFVISVVIHALALLIFINVRLEQAYKQASGSIPVDFKKVTETKPEKKRPKFEPIKHNPFQRQTDMPFRVRPFEITTAARVVRTDADRGVVSFKPFLGPTDMGMPTDMGDPLSGRSSAAKKRPIRSGKSQLVEFIDKSKGKREIVYCLDVSASMVAPGPNKLNLSRNYLKDSLLALNDQDRFNIIAFAKDIRIFHPETSVPATKENLMDAMNFLDEYTFQNIKSNTKTDLLTALICALEMKPSIIVAVTDGLPTAGVIQPEKILQSIRERNADGNTTIFTIGMEMDMEQPEAWLMRSIAEQNNGEFQFF